MKTFFAKLRRVAIAGFLFLLPVYVVLVIATKAWTSLSSVGTDDLGAVPIAWRWYKRGSMTVTSP